MGIALARWPVRPLLRRAGRLLLLILIPVGIASGAGWAPLAPSLLLCLLGSVLAFRGQRLMHWFRRTDPVTRLLATLCAILLPALPLYLSLVSLSDEARRNLVAARYAVRAAEHPQDLNRQLDLTLGEIDAELEARPARPAPAAVPDQTGTGIDAAFTIWSRTALAASRLTSAVEIFGADGELQSRFALNIPDSVTASRWTATGCEWEVFGEVAPFGSEDRRMLHAERGFCDHTAGAAGVPAGGVVVHVAQVDYESLPFIASRSPYVEPMETGRGSPGPGAPGHEVELVIYGWGRQPAFLSNRSAWPIDDALFDRIYASRSPFWTPPRQGLAPVRGVHHEYPRRHLCAGLPGAHRVRSSAAPLGDGVAGPCRRRPRAAGGGPRRPGVSAAPAAVAVPRGADAVCPQAADLVRGGRDRPGGGGRDPDSGVLRGSVAGRRRGRRGSGGGGGEERHRRVRPDPVARWADYRPVHRRHPGPHRSGDRTGRQYLRRPPSRRDEHARSLRVGRIADTHAGRGLSRHRPRPAARLRGRGRGRSPPVPVGGGAGPGGGPRGGS